MLHVFETDLFQSIYDSGSWQEVGIHHVWPVNDVVYAAFIL